MGTTRGSPTWLPRNRTISGSRSTTTPTSTTHSEPNWSDHATCPIQLRLRGNHWLRYPVEVVSRNAKKESSSSGDRLLHRECKSLARPATHRGHPHLSLKGGAGQDDRRTGGLGQRLRSDIPGRHLDRGALSHA